MKRSVSAIVSFFALCIFVLSANVAVAETVIKKELRVFFPDVTRMGVYSGEINENGNPDGFGVFEATNSRGIKYIIVGDWVDGHQTGEAWELWETGDFKIGQFDDSHFVSGKYAQDIKMQEYHEPQKSEIMNNSTSLIMYEDLLKYGELIDPTAEKYRNPGSIPVQLEAITTNVVEGTYGIDIEMWIRGEKGYYYNKTYLDNDDHKFNANIDKSVQPHQRIVLEVTPYSDGTYYSKQILSLSVLEKDIDFKEIKPAEFKTYEEISQMNVDSQGNEKETGVMEMIVGDYGEVWIKGQTGYFKTRMLFGSDYFDFPPVEKGQKWYVGVEPYEGKIISSNFCVMYQVMIEEGIDVKPFEDAYLESEKAALAEDPLTKHLLEPFDSNDFGEISYKRILRNIEEQAGSAIRIEGKYKQELDGNVSYEYALMADNDGNYYHLEMMKHPIDVMDTKLLENDKIIVYGYIQDRPYEYTSVIRSNKTVPSVFVVHIDLLEDD